MDFTKLAKPIFARLTVEADSWTGNEVRVQRRVLLDLLNKAQDTEFGRRHGFAKILLSPSPEQAFAEAVPAEGYEAFRNDIMKMADGARDVLWPGVCLNFAQSSGTSGGRSKFVPVTKDGLSRNHYRGAAFPMAFYLDQNPESCIFSGKGFILGGSFESKMKPGNPRAKVGDLSATLIDRINPLINIFRIPSRRIALLSDWNVKLALLARASARENVTNISGVPSWFMRVLLRVMSDCGVSSVREVWPGLEVFFHGGISFEPYREEYLRICGPEMKYVETYNASEGFFAAQRRLGDGRQPMQLLLDCGTYFEFLPLGGESPLRVDQIEAGKVYELVISNCNGLWRYRLGDTVRIESTSPLMITMAGRTGSFINAFGEELMESNAESAMAEACAATGASVSNYTAGPVYASADRLGRHEWVIEWEKAPESVQLFAEALDRGLRRVNSDYDAKRNGDIFLAGPLITTVPPHTFDRWLSRAGNGKLGGQRKIPRLSNSRSLIEQILGTRDEGRGTRSI